MSFSMRGSRSANTASATGAPGMSLAVIASPSVQEVAFAGEHHGEAELVGAFEYLLVADRTARLDDDRYPGVRGRLHTIGEGIERVRRARTADGAPGGLARRDLAGLHTVLLSGTDADGLAVLHEH